MRIQILNYIIEKTSRQFTNIEQDVNLVAKGFLEDLGDGGKLSYQDKKYLLNLVNYEKHESRIGMGFMVAIMYFAAPIAGAFFGVFLGLLLWFFGVTFSATIKHCSLVVSVFVPFFMINEIDEKDCLNLDSVTNKKESSLAKMPVIGKLFKIEDKGEIYLENRADGYAAKSVAKKMGANDEPMIDLDDL